MGPICTVVLGVPVHPFRTSNIYEQVLLVNKIYFIGVPPHPQMSLNRLHTCMGCMLHGPVSRMTPHPVGYLFLFLPFSPLSLPSDDVRTGFPLGSVT